MSGSTVKNHISLKMVFEYSVIRKISYQSWFLVDLQLLQARLPQHPRLLHVRKLIIQITIQQSSQVKVWIDKHGGDPFTSETSEELLREPTEIPKPNKNEDHEQVRGDTYSDTPEWLQEFRENLVDERVPEHRDSHASSSQEPSLEPGVAEKCGLKFHYRVRSITVFGYSLPERPKLRDLPTGPKSQGLRAEDVLVESNLVQKILVI